MGKSNTTGLKKLLLHIFLIAISVSILIPFAYIVLVSFSRDIFLSGSLLIPVEFTLQNYTELFTKHRFSNWLLNSIILSLGTMVCSVILTTITVYALSRLRFRGREKLFSMIMTVQVFPLTLTMVSIHKIFTAVGLLDKLSGLVIADSIMASAGLVLLAKGYFDSISYELDEAAQIDGAGKFTIMRKIIVPLVKPMIAIIGIQSFVFAYNEYVIANVVMTGGFKSMPIAVGLQSLLVGQYGINWPKYCAAAVISSIPMILIFYSMQKYFITGLSDNAVKG